ncbi:MAG: cupredoxin domain-containing protein [Candidatus Nanosalina sp.]
MDFEDNKYVLGGAAALVLVVAAGAVMMDGGGQSSLDGQDTQSAIQPTEESSSTKGTQTTQTSQKESGSSSGNIVRVEMSGTSFNPSTIQVDKGDKIKFVNTDGYAHNVHIQALGIDRDVAGGQSTTVTVDKSGTFKLVCEIHAPAMKGTIKA